MWDVFGTAEEISAAQAAFLRAGRPGTLTGVTSTIAKHGGVQSVSAEGVETRTISHRGEIIGYGFETADAVYCLLGGLLPTETDRPPEAQTEEVFQIIEEGLAQAGLLFRDVVRTWFYNHDILKWYAEFNRVRTRYFHEQGITLMPASTGIGAANRTGAALTAKALAIRPKTGNIQIEAGDSPLQKSAFEYGSAFSRAMLVAEPQTRTLYISGTASIAADGKTIHRGNAARQIGYTMEVVSAMLGAAGMDLHDTSRAVAYFRNAEDITHWRKFCRSEGLEEMPVVETGATICRDDLLFELELDAIRVVPP